MEGDLDSTFKLGAIGADLGAIACFFEPAWSRVSPALTEADQAWLLNEAAFSLRALGRLNEAVEPMRAGLQMAIEQGDWKNSAISASNLSELELKLGNATTAVRDAEQSVVFADRSGDGFLRMLNRTTLADALYQVGSDGGALARFCEAEEMQAVGQPADPLLYSLPGFQYCDFLLADPERAAWQAGGAAGRGARRERSRQDAGGPSGAVEACRDVEQRAATALEIVMKGTRNLLDIGLNHLTLGRAGLYRSILERPEPPGDQTEALGRAASEIESAVDGLRRAGQSDELPKGLLTRAWLRALTGDDNGARRDLDEAWEIAERGPMPLFQADVHLHRARLFRDPAGLAEARWLIEKHGYGRRRSELADAEVAAEDW